jgi:hypothetical protein
MQMHVEQLRGAALRVALGTIAMGLVAVPTAPASAAGGPSQFVIPAGVTAQFSGVTFGACNGLSWGYQLNSGADQVQASKPSGCFSEAAPDVTIGPFASTTTMRVFMRDNTCGATYYSDGTPVDHVIVSGSGSNGHQSPYTLRFADAGGFCERTSTTVNTFEGSNFEVSLTIPDNDLGLTGTPADITTDATSPAGAAVSYTAPTATDEDSPATASVSCSPISGSTFGIGDTTVTCTATDADDSNSPVTSSFTVHVRGAAAQLVDLARAVTGVGPGSSLADKIASVQSYLARGDTRDACGSLSAFLHEIAAQSGKSIPVANATTLMAAAQQIETVIPCTS